MDLKQHIGLRIKQARTQKGWTQEQFAQRLSRAVETVSNVERGAVFTGLETLESMAKLLGKPLIYFFEGAEKSKLLKLSQGEAQMRAKVLVEGLTEQQLRPIISMLEALAEESAPKPRR